MRKQLEDVDHLMRPGGMVHLDGIEILAVPAYNEGKWEALSLHSISPSHG